MTAWIVAGLATAAFTVAVRCWLTAEGDAADLRRERDDARKQAAGYRAEVMRLAASPLPAAFLSTAADIEQLPVTTEHGDHR
jgi:hypothetical protein